MRTKRDEKFGNTRGSPWAQTDSLCSAERGDLKLYGLGGSGNQVVVMASRAPRGEINGVEYLTQHRFPAAHATQCGYPRRS
jgi:hypothetical protein